MKYTKAVFSNTIRKEAYKVSIDGLVFTASTTTPVQMRSNNNNNS